MPRYAYTHRSQPSWICSEYAVYCIRQRTRNPAVTRIAVRSGCQWPSRSSKFDDFHAIWKPICHILLVINSNLSPISHRLGTRSTKVNDFHLICQSVCQCHFLWVINFVRIFYRFQDITSFPLKTHILPLFPPFNPKFENVSLAPDRWNFASLCLRHD